MSDLLVLLSLFCAIGMFCLAHVKGMPIKRWTFLGGVLGPVALLLFSVHLRRAWMRIHRSMFCVMWRA
ncbi:hypothetical protein PALB_6620 [Pseudoalteromonas luteoviolacea B = ATCC 29581]|nr:hypothetical protein PALB_6620 [Pseudoalteromonas luteoviolacea B = ATCC 29581]